MSAVLEELSSTIGGIADRVGPSVVGIGRGWGVGSGVVVAEGRVLTNAHNLRRDETTVRFADGRRERGRVAGADADSDLAVIEVDTGDAPALEWGDPEAAGIGTPVFALANPGGRGLRVTFGTVSSANRSFRGPRGRRIQGAIEHTAPLPRGSSGGPLVDGDGRLLGVNSIRLDGNLILALAADARRTAGRPPRRGRGGRAPRPRHRGRAAPRGAQAAPLGGPARPGRRARARRQGRFARRPGRRGARRPHHRGGRQAGRGRRRPLHAPSTPPATASPSRRCGGPRKPSVR